MVTICYPWLGMEEAQFSHVLGKGNVSSRAKESEQASPELTLICLWVDLLGGTEVKVG